jgi:periplasmic divalent cation tolerance protein
MSDNVGRLATYGHTSARSFYRTFRKTQSKKRAGRQKVPKRPDMEQLDAVVVLTTWPSDTDANQMAATLVREQLAACVNILPPMDSVYRWHGAVEQARERQVVIKTTAAMAEPLLARLKALHPYDVPEMLVLPVVGGGDAYLDWVRLSVTRDLAP